MVSKLRFQQYILPALISLIAPTISVADIPNNDVPNTFVGPYVHGSIANHMQDNSAFSIGVDLGTRTYRVDGTLAWQDNSNQRFKVSAEWLTQDITYSFFSGNHQDWVWQGVLGGSYLYLFQQHYFNPEFMLDAYIQHGSSTTLATKSGTYTNAAGTPINFTNSRRISGATSGGIAPGASFNFWPGGRLGLVLHYDNVSYDTVYVSDKNAKGLGGSISAKQQITQDVGMGASAAFLQPYNLYEAWVNFASVNFYGNWLFSVEGDYTIGKNSMPNTYNVGLNIDYSFTHPDVTSINELEARKHFLAWTSQSAAKKSQVLGLPDQRVT